MPPRFRMRADDCYGDTCSYPRCNACLRKENAPDCKGTGCAEPKCRTCEGTETDREEEKRYHKAREYLVSLVTGPSQTPEFVFRNPPIPEHGKVSGGQPSVSRPAIPQAWVDWMPNDGERYKCKTCKNWDKYWKRASTLTDEERRQQDETKLHYFFGKCGIVCTCAPEDMAQRVVKEYHLDWEPKDKDGRVINFRTFGPHHMNAEVLLDVVKASKRATKTELASMARNKRRHEEMNLIWDSMLRPKAATKGRDRVVGKDHNSRLGPSLVQGAQEGHIRELSSSMAPDSTVTTEHSNAASLVAEPSLNTSELSRKRRYAETIDSESNDRLLPSVKEQDQSSLSNDLDYRLSFSDDEFLEQISGDPWCNKREARLKRIVTQLRSREAEIRRRHVRDLQRFQNELDKLLQGRTCEARERLHGALDAKWRGP